EGRNQDRNGQAKGRHGGGTVVHPSHQGKLLVLRRFSARGPRPARPRWEVDAALFQSRSPQPRIGSSSSSEVIGGFVVAISAVAASAAGNCRNTPEPIESSYA